MVVLQDVSLGIGARSGAGLGRVAAVRKLVFAVVVIIFGALIVYGVAAGDFGETASNGRML
jgi:hypothetical protein